MHVKPSSGEVVIRYVLPLCAIRTKVTGSVRSQLDTAIAATGMIDDSFEGRLQDWVSRGRRYDTVVKDLEGPGALILLSNDMDSV